MTRLKQFKALRDFVCGSGLSGAKDKAYILVVVAGFGAAGFAGFFPAAHRFGNFSATLLIAARGTCMWFLLTLCAISVWKRRGAWLLLGAPAALFWPTIILMALIGCALGFPCL